MIIKFKKNLIIFYDFISMIRKLFYISYIEKILILKYIIILIENLKYKYFYF